eukprot:3079808-Prymnesium_polylepis.1
MISSHVESDAPSQGIGGIAFARAGSRADRHDTARQRRHIGKARAEPFGTERLKDVCRSDAA